MFDKLSQWFDSFLHGLSAWSHEHLMSIFIILIVAWIIRKFGPKLTMQAISHTMRADLYPTQTDRKKRIKTLQSLIEAIFQVGSWLVAFMFIVSELKPGYTAALFTSAGIIGVALGFGSQSLVKDFVSGIFIIFENQYRVGDIVTLNDITGKVEAITVRTTMLRDLDGYVHHIPNGSITVTTNRTMDYGRINEDLKVKANTDIKLIEKVVNEAGKKLASQSKYKSQFHEAPHFDRIVSIDSSGITFKVLGKVDLSAQDEARSELLLAIKQAFDKAKIEF